jgi:hypothetical protein
MKAFNLISLLVGMVAMLSAGTLYSFPVYAPAFSVLGMSQGVVNLIAAFGVLGFSLGFPLSLLLERSGPCLMMIGAAGCFLLGYLVLYYIVSGGLPPSIAGALLSYMVVGIGTRGAYLADLASNLRNWALPLRGRVVAIMVCTLGLSSAIFTGIYVGALSSSPVSFVLLLLCTTSSLALVGGLCVSEEVLSVTPHHHAYISLLRPRHPNAVELENVAAVSVWAWRVMIKDVRFWCLCVAHFFGTGAGQLYINVLGSWYASLGGAPGGQSTAVIVLSVCNALGRLYIGLLSDLTLHRIKRSVWILPSLAFLALSMALSIAASSTSWIVGISALIGLGYGGNAAFLATITADSWGCEYFGRNWGLVDTFNGLGYLVLGQISASLYNQHVAVGSVFCIGTECYTFTWVMCLVSVGVATVATILLIVKSPAPSCEPVSERKRNGLLFFHFFGHAGLHELHLKHKADKGHNSFTSPEAQALAWKASEVLL